MILDPPREGRYPLGCSVSIMQSPKAPEKVRARAAQFGSMKVIDKLKASEKKFQFVSQSLLLFSVAL